MGASSFAERDWYRAAPRYYDLIFDAGTAQESEFLAGCVARFGRPNSKHLLEPACGTGRLLQAMAARGFAVAGFDLAPEMLAIAQERFAGASKPAKLWLGRMESFAAGRRFDAAFNLVSTFKYLLREQDARAHLQCVAESLLPGGIYVLGLHLSDYADTRRSRERWHVSRGKLHVTCNIQSWPACAKTRSERVRSRLLARQGTQSRKLETNWTFRTYDARQLRRLLQSVPSLQLVAQYDFCHDLGRPRAFNDDQLDLVLILRQQAG